MRRNCNAKRSIGLVRRGNGVNRAGENGTQLDEQGDPMEERRGCVDVVKNLLVKIPEYPVIKRSE